MLLIICCSLLIAVASVCIGYATISKTAISSTESIGPARLADTIFASYWTGLSILLILATAAVCFGPVGSAGIFALIALLLIALAVKSVRNLISLALRNLRRVHMYAIVGGVSLSGLLSVLVLPWHGCHEVRECMGDTGLYHAQIIRWYSSIGAAPGMALLHHRLGFHSGVFALAAIFDVGPLVGRSGSAISLATVLVSLVFAVLNLSRRRFSARNLFWPIYLLIVLCTFDISIAADYPDTTLTFMVGAFFWMVWTWWEWGVAAACGWTLILVGAGAVSIKLSGTLLLGVAFFMALWLAGVSRRNLLRYSALTLILAAPMLAVQSITSGHPLYPAFPLALPVSWAVPDKLVLAARDSIRRFPLYGYDPPQPMTFARKAWKILLGQAPYVAGMLLVFGASAALAFRDGKPAFPVKFAGVLGAIGLLMLFQVAHPRFAIGYLAALPALVLAQRPHKMVLGVCAAALAIMYIGGPGSNRLDIARMVFYVAGICCLMVTSFARSPVAARAVAGCLLIVQLMRPLATMASDIPAIVRHPSWLVLPSGPLIPPSAEAFTEAALGEVTFKQPVDGFHCWAEPLPCAPPPYQANWLTIDALWYRCKAHRLACGFTAIPPASGP